MAPRAILDTNVLIYAHDRSEPLKQQRALQVLERIRAIQVGALTTQILAEFFSTATRRLSAQLTSDQAALQVERFGRIWPVYDITLFTVLEAIRGARSYKMSLWDAQIWASARLYQIPIVLSEDFASGSFLEGVRFVNPFADDFDLEAWFPG